MKSSFTINLEKKLVEWTIDGIVDIDSISEDYLKLVNLEAWSPHLNTLIVLKDSCSLNDLDLQKMKILSAKLYKIDREYRDNIQSKAALYPEAVLHYSIIEMWAFIVDGVSPTNDRFFNNRNDALAWVMEWYTLMNQVFFLPSIARMLIWMI